MDAAADTVLGKTPENDDGVALGAMLRAEGRGSYDVLASFMGRLGSRLSVSPLEEIRTAYRELTERAAKALEHEAKYGRRSLMKWDHPDNVKCVRIGLIKLNADDRRAFEAANGFV
ncbi:hypothetical protein [Mesorhizobium abyssinicae]|uniref:hypothetical protein n=1 Tax=Mesorhizobium abyssinicae TaxID=1209958 RepID=UPI00339771D4